MTLFKYGPFMKKITTVIFILFLFCGAGIFYFTQQKNLPKTWMKEQVQEDLGYYSKNDLDPVLLEEIFADAAQKHNSVYERSVDGPLFVHFQIIDNKVYFKKCWDDNESIDRVRKIYKLLSRVCKERKLPDCDFLLTVHDGFRAEAYKDSKKYVPSFCFAKTKEKEGVLFPDPLTENFARRGRQSIEKNAKKSQFSWDEKEEIAFWRGGTTGGHFTIENWFTYPRSQLSILSKYYPDLIDAGYASFVGMEQSVKAELLNHIPQKSWTVHKDHLKYKYLIIPDGNTCTYPRYYLSLVSNSVTFKQDSDQVQWFYRALTPYQEYVPVNSDFSNLPELVIWAKEHDDEALKISQNANEFIKHNLMPKHINDYVELLIKSYAKIQNEKISLCEGMQTHEAFKKKK